MVEVNEEVCATRAPLSAEVLDIRGREEEWYYCHEKYVELSCKTRFRSKWAVIHIRPSVVIRGWSTGAVRDTHFHAYLVPEGDGLRFHDLFARTLSRDLQKADVILDAAGGGRGENSATDSYYVRVDFGN